METALDWSKCFFCGDFVRETDGICALTGKPRCIKHECREKAVEWAREMRAEREAAAREAANLLPGKVILTHQENLELALKRIADRLENIERHMAFNNGTIERLMRTYDLNLRRR